MSGVGLVKQSGQAFDEIAKTVAELTELIESIANATDVQAEGLSQIETTIGEIDKSTQQNAAMAEECTAAASSLAQEADSLRVTVSAFEVDGPSATLRGAMPQRSAREVIEARQRSVKAPTIRGNLALKTDAHDWSEF